LKKKIYFSLQILVIIDDFLKFWQKNDNFLLLVFFLKLIFKIDQKMMPKLHFFLQILAHCEFFCQQNFPFFLFFEYFLRGIFRREDIKGALLFFSFFGDEINLSDKSYFYFAMGAQK